jgi:hypothetical protein
VGWKPEVPASARWLAVVQLNIAGGLVYHPHLDWRDGLHFFISDYVAVVPQL